MSSAEMTDGPDAGQWVHADLFGASLPPGSLISLGEGRTALQKAGGLGAALGISDLWLKREDLSPTGSHKARSLGLMVSTLHARRRSQAVISSSGNAAVAAAAYCSAAGLRLLSLVSPRTPAVKLRALAESDQLTVLTERPVELLHHCVETWGMADLRTSVNAQGAVAYRGIAAELTAAGEWEAVFNFSNSGATTLGLGQGFGMLLQDRPWPQLHPVEGSPGGELTRPWYDREMRWPLSGVGDLGTRRSRLAPAVRRLVRQSGGRGWRVRSEEMQSALEAAQGHGLLSSWEGMAALAAARQHAQACGGGTGRWVVLMTGAADQLDQSPADESGLPSAASPQDLDRILRGAGFRREDPR